MTTIEEDCKYLFFSMGMQEGWLMAWVRNTSGHRVKREAMQWRRPKLQLFDMLFSAIDLSFMWSYTPEGHDYWADIDERYIEITRQCREF